MLAPLRAGDDGSHSVTMSLQPEGLGNVQATVSVAGEEVSVSLWADSATGHAALSQTINQLHSQLTEGSDRRVNVDLADFGSAQPDPRGDRTPQGHASPGQGNSKSSAEHIAPDYGRRDSETDAISGEQLDGGRRVDIRL